MDRIKRAQLDTKAEYLTRRLLSGEQQFLVQSQGAGYGRGYRLIEVPRHGTKGSGSHHYVHNDLKTAREMLNYLDGMIDCLSQYATAGV